MSILIPDMEMPKTCEECTLESFCNLWIDARRMTDGRKAEIRHPDCPLIPVVGTTTRCPHCGGKIERRGSEYYCYSCHFWWEADDDNT